MSHDAWASRVDRELLLSLDKKEIARQEVLNEIIYSEEKFLSDLTILREASQNTKKKKNILLILNTGHYTRIGTIECD